MKFFFWFGVALIVSTLIFCHPSCDVTWIAKKMCMKDPDFQKARLDLRNRSLMRIKVYEERYKDVPYSQWKPVDLEAYDRAKFHVADTDNDQ